MADEELAEIGEEDASDVFEIDDFTAASEWERFIYRIEDILGPHGWRLDNSEKQQHADSTNSTNKIKESTDSVWKSESKQLKFHTINFLLAHHKLEEESNLEPSDKQNEELPKALLESVDFSFDFCPRSYPLSRWFGLKEFLVFSSLNDTTDTESKIKVLLSSMNIALSDCKCQIPMFAQVGNLARRMYFGSCIGGGFRTSYEMINLKYTPHECNHVQGMVNVFQEKLACPLVSPVTVSIRFAYSIRHWPPENRLTWNDDDIAEDDVIFDKMPFGPLEDPIRELQVATSWPCISSEILVDDEISTQLEALHAPLWKLKARGHDFTQTALSKSLRSLLTLSQQRSRPTKHIIRSLSTGQVQEGLSGNVGQALDRLAAPSFSQPASASPKSTSPKKISSFPQLNDTSKHKLVKTNLTESPLAPEILDLLLVCLFPDAGLTKEKTSELQAKFNEQQEELESENVRHKERFRHIKSAPEDSLTYKLGLAIACVNNEHGGLQAVAHLWHEFVLEMRYRFESNINIPCLARVPPNLNYCLLHQKLQMLNCCIERSQARHQRNNSSSDGDLTVTQASESSFASCKSVSYKDFDDTPSQMDLGSPSTQRNTPLSGILANLEGNPKKTSPTKDASWGDLLSRLEPTENNDKSSLVGSKQYKTSISDDEESDDEFFEAQEEMEQDMSPSVTTESSDTVNKDEENRTADGVAKETTMKLLCTGKVLCIPETQEAPPLTEDALMEQQEILTQLGTSEEGSRVRLQMQCASLLSDMEAFKAANPGCILDDFVRWYSPNDWLRGSETEEERTELEKIMKEKAKTNIDSSNEGWEFELDDDETATTPTNRVSTRSEEGRLSLRMRVPGNTWQEVWEQAKPVPARRQKRLFDDTKEAEKILHYFDNLSPSELVLHVFPIILQASMKRIMEEGESDVNVYSLVEELIKETSRLHLPSFDSLNSIEHIIKKLYDAEMLILKTRSLRHKLYPPSKMDQLDDELEVFIKDLLTKPEVPIKGAANSRIGKSITQLLYHQKGVELIAAQKRSNQNPQMIQQPAVDASQIKSLPKPIGREYILRTSLPVPSKFSRPSPQRLFVVIMSDEFRMAGSFTQDTTFI